MNYQHRKVQLDHRTIDRHVPTLKRRNDSGSFVAEAYREGVPIETKRVPLDCGKWNAKL